MVGFLAVPRHYFTGRAPEVSSLCRPNPSTSGASFVESAGKLMANHLYLTKKITAAFTRVRNSARLVYKLSCEVRWWASAYHPTMTALPALLAILPQRHACLLVPLTTTRVPRWEGLPAFISAIALIFSISNHIHTF